MGNNKNHSKMAVFFCRFCKTWFFRFLGLFIWRKKNFVGLGSWVGCHFNDNSKYIALYLSKNCPQYHLFWFGNSSIVEQVRNSLPNAIFVERGSFKSYLTALRCRYFLYDQKIESDICDVNIYMGAIKIELSHGVPLKKWERSAIDYRKPSIFKKMVFSFLLYPTKDSFYSITSLEYESCLLQSVPCSKKQMIYSGYPRNDFLYHASAEKIKEIKKKYSRLLGFPEDKKIVLYAPTYRRTGKEYGTLLDFQDQNLSNLFSVLSNNDSVLLEKTHYASSKNGNSFFQGNNLIYHVGQNTEVDFQELLLISDVLVGDYSGAMIDFLLLNRPEMLFLYDYEFYKNTDSGLFYDVKDFSFGPAVFSEAEFADCLKKVLEGPDVFSAIREKGRLRFLTFEKGMSSKTIATFMGRL